MPGPRKLGGTLQILPFESRLLRDNPLRDPYVRETPIYLPPSYFSKPGRHFPTLYLLTGFPSRSKMLLNDTPYTENLVTKLDRLMGSGKVVEAIVVMPDGYTRLGASQYLNSIASGRYEDMVARELVSYMNKHYRAIPKPGARAILGKSSGGYGAIVLGMKHPDVFGLVVCHSGDMGFDYCYRPDFTVYLREIRKYGGTARFVRGMGKMNLGRKDLFPLLNTIAMATAYSPRKGFPPFALPFDEEMGTWRSDVWREWLRKDPLVMVRRYARNLRKLRLLYFDCGTEDEFLLYFGARQLADRLRRLRVKYRYEEFPDGHMNISYRYDRSLALISKAILRE